MIQELLYPMGSNQDKNWHQGTEKVFKMGSQVCHTVYDHHRKYTVLWFWNCTIISLKEYDQTELLMSGNRAKSTRSPAELP